MGVRLSYHLAHLSAHFDLPQGKWLERQARQAKEADIDFRGKRRREQEQELHVYRESLTKAQVGRLLTLTSTLTLTLKPTPATSGP